MLSLLLAERIFQLFIIMALGFVIVKSGLLKSSDSVVLSKVVLYIVVPCTILNIFQINLTADIKNGIVLAFGVVIFLHFLAIFIGYSFRKLCNGSVVEEMSVVYPNAGNLMIPLISYIMGDEWLIYATAYMATQTVFFWTHCVHRFSGEKHYHLKKIFLNGNMISIIIGMLMMITGVKLPASLDAVTDTVGDMIGPLSMLVAGMLAANMDLKDIIRRKRLYLVLLFKMVITPIVVIALIKLTHIADLVQNGDKILLIVCMAAMAPSASTVVQFAQIYKHDAEYAGAINIMTLLTCIITMPVFVYIYGLL